MSPCAFLGFPCPSPDSFWLIRAPEGERGPFLQGLAEALILEAAGLFGVREGAGQLRSPPQGGESSRFAALEAFVLWAMAGVPSHGVSGSRALGQVLCWAGFSEKLGPRLGLPAGSREAR